MKPFSILVVFLVSLFSIGSIAQEVTIGEPENKSIITADSLFTKGNWKAALDYYKKFVTDFPRDPSFKLKLGICQIKSTREIDQAIENLKMASTQDVPNEVFFYLGEAHLLNYQFEDAINYYRRFMINGGSPGITSQTVEQQVNKCENGAFMLKYIYQPKVVARERVHINEFYQYITTKSNKGAFVQKPNDLKTGIDKDKGDSSLIFYPHNPVAGDKIYYSSYGSNTSNGREIYVIERLSDGFWSKPQNLGGVINTPFDEEFPYMAPDGVTLYFASKGHYSMGGFDIYKSTYNPSTRKWSTPENLGFPFSSTYDDFLFVPNDEESLACFVTNRNLENSSIDVVLVEIDQNPIRKSISSLETIHSIALLEPISKALEDETKPAGTKETKKPKPATFNSVENDTEYIRVLAKGFEEQMKADSARIKLEALRQKFDYITTAEERRKLEAQVVIMENILLEAQKNADSYFAQASQIEQEYISGKRKPEDKPTSTFATDKPEFLYQAQFASTVFHTDELNRLAQAEKSAPQLETLHRQIAGLKAQLGNLSPNDSTGSYTKIYADYLSKLKAFNSVASGYYSTKKGLYRECISVAVVKRGATDDADIRTEIDRANKHFQSAIAIRNNASEEAQIQSEFDALLLDELGVLRLELAFSKLWGMKLFEQEVLSKLYRMEQNIFGRILTDSSPKTAGKSETTVKEEPAKEDSAQPAITKTEELVDTKPIVFEPEAEPPFRILDESPYNSQNPIPPHLPLPQGVVYKIQLAAFSNPVAVSHFKGMYPLFQEPLNGGKVTKYYAGLFVTLAEAQNSLTVVKSKGFKDAFIAAWHNGRSVSLSRAEILEKTEPGYVPEPNVDIQIENADQLYLIQIGTYKGRLPDDISQTVRALAPGKDIVRKPDNQGGFIYSVSSFSTSTEANRVKDNLVASGLINAIVIAVELEK